MLFQVELCHFNCAYVFTLFKVIWCKRKCWDIFLTRCTNKRLLRWKRWLSRTESSLERAISLRWPAFESHIFLSRIQMLPDQTYDIPYHNGILIGRSCRLWFYRWMSSVSIFIGQSGCSYCSRCLIMNGM